MSESREEMYGKERRLAQTALKVAGGECAEMVGIEKRVLDLGDLLVAEKYLFVTIFCAAFGAIYEHFSFGVYSVYMTYAFGFPLVLGVFPFFRRGMNGEQEMRKGRELNGSRKIRRFEEPNENERSAKARIDRRPEKCWHAGVATLTVGSMVRGVLDIYGTDSPFILWYWVIGAGLLTVAFVKDWIAKYGNK